MLRIHKNCFENFYRELVKIDVDVMKKPDAKINNRNNTKVRKHKILSLTSEYYSSKHLHLVKSTFKRYKERYVIHRIMHRDSVLQVLGKMSLKNCPLESCPPENCSLGNCPP